MKEYDGAIAECQKAIEKTKKGDFECVKIAKVYARIASAQSLKGDIRETLKAYEEAFYQYEFALMEGVDEAEIEQPMNEIKQKKDKLQIDVYM